MGEKVRLTEAQRLTDAEMRGLIALLYAATNGRPHPLMARASKQTDYSRPWNITIESRTAKRLKAMGLAEDRLVPDLGGSEKHGRNYHIVYKITEAGRARCHGIERAPQCSHCAAALATDRTPGVCADAEWSWLCEKCGTGERTREARAALTSKDPTP